jgi:hypothetical protein
MDKGEHAFPISQANLKFEAFNAPQLHPALLMKGATRSTLVKSNNVKIT